MDLHDTIRWVAIPVALVLWGAWVYLVGDRRLRLTLGLMLALLVASVLPLYGEDDHYLDWLKHGLYYLSQVVYWIFLERLSTRINQYEENTLHATPIRLQAGWFGFLTEQGMQHILVMPFVFLIATTVWLRSSMTSSSPLKRALWWSLGLSVAFGLLHLGEFVIESQQWIPQLVSVIEYLEVALILAGLGCLAMAMVSLRPLIGRTPRLF